MSDALSYVYAVTRDADDRAVAGVQGVEGAAVRFVDVAELRAVVSDVDRAIYEELALEERLEDLEWLATTARAHHHVVDTVGRDHVVAPFSLATVYRSDDRVREVLEISGESLRRVLDRLAGRAEWGVKAYARARPETEEPARPRSGTEYLRRRRAQLRAGDTLVEDAQRAAEEVHRSVLEVAEQHRLHRPQEAALTGSTERMVLNGAYLLTAEAASDLAALVGSLAEHPRLRVELTGPWVPYSFSQVDP